MGIGAWFRSLFKKEEDDVVEIICPKCGSKEFSYFTYLSNFVEVMREIESPKYMKSGKCNSCGYTISEISEL